MMVKLGSDFEKALTVLYTETDTTRALKRKICDLKKLDYGVLMHLSDANQRELDDDRKVADQISNGDAIYWDPKKNAHLGSLTVGSYTISMFTLLLMYRRRNGQLVSMLIYH